MHFWIDKRNQRCGFNGRYLVPPSLSGSRRAKLMVTPVHRFQSIESVAANGIRHPRGPGYVNRFPVHCHPFPVNYNASNSSSSRNPHQVAGHSSDVLPGNHSVQQHHHHHQPYHHNTVTPRRVSNTPTAKLKCGVWAFFAIVTFFLAGAKYYFHGVNMGMEALAFCSLIVVILIVGGVVSLYEALTWAPVHVPSSAPVHTAQEQSDICEQQLHVPPSSTPSSSELPPPPYHIAVMLPSQTTEQHETVDIIRDSPPPSYDKAVT